MLAENTTKPYIVDVTGELFFNDNGCDFFLVKNWSEIFLGSFGSPIAMHIYKNRLKPNRELPNYIIICYFLDYSLTDKSMSNKCVQAITDGQAPNDWRGPILVLKCRGFVLCFNLEIIARNYKSHGSDFERSPLTDGLKSLSVTKNISHFPPNMEFWNDNFIHMSNF